MANGKIVHLSFDTSATNDKCENNWTAHGNPTISTTNAINGKALQLNGDNQYLTLDSTIELGGQDFTVDGWFCGTGGIFRLNYPEMWWFFSIDLIDDYLDCYWDDEGSNSFHLYPDFNNDNKLHHFAIVYQHSIFTVTLYIDGVAVASDIANQYGDSAGLKRRQFNGTLGSAYHTFNGTIDEFRIYDGVALWTDTFTPPTATDYQGGSEFSATVDFDLERRVQRASFAYTVDFDIERKIENADLVWRYESYCTAENAANHAGYMGDIDWASIDVPELHEIWLRCGFVFRAGDYSSVLIGNGYYSSKQDPAFCGWGMWNRLLVNYRDSQENNPPDSYYSDISTNFTEFSIHDFYLHMKSGITDGLIEIFFDNQLVATHTGNVNNGNTFNDMTSTADIRYKLIVSNRPIEYSQSIEVDFDLERDVQSSFFAYSVDFDVVRIVGQNIWRYENYGTADLLLVDAETLTNLTSDQSVTTCAFKQTKAIKCFDIPATDDVWIKFDVCIDDSVNYGTWLIVIADTNGTGVSLNVPVPYIILDELIYPNYYAINARANGKTVETATNRDGESGGNYVSSLEDRTISFDGVQTCLLHMKSGVIDGLIECWFSDVHLTYTGNVNDGNYFENLYIGSGIGAHLYSNVIISSSEIGLNEVAHYWTHTDFEIDTERRITQNGIWRYENYGTAKFLTVSGTTAELPQAQSKYYSGFYQPSRTKCFDIPDTKEIWLKCDIYVANANSSNRIRIYNDDPTNSVSGWTTSSQGVSSNYFLWHNGTSIDGGYRISNGATDGAGYQSFLLHMKSGATDGFIEFYFWSSSHKTYKSYTGNVNGGNNFNNFYIQMEGSGIFVSNVIISNGAVAISENCRVPIADDFDISRRIIRAFAYELHNDLVRQVALTHTAFFDLERLIQPSNKFYFDLQRSVTKSIEEYFDTEAKQPHKLTDDTPTLKSIQIELSAQQLTDRLTYATAEPIDIMQQVRGRYLDYDFDMRVEELSQQGVISACRCCSDIDELLYTSFNYTINADYLAYEVNIKSKTVYRTPVAVRSGMLLPETDSDTTLITKATAERHMQIISAGLGKELVAQFDNFVSDMDIEQKNVTYADLISNLFGWTSRLPQMLINCYLRNDKIFVIQRGHEANTINIADYHCSVPTIQKKLIRTTWQGSPDSSYTLNETTLAWKMSVPPPTVSEDGKTHYTYKNIEPHGYLLTGSRTHNDDGSEVITEYHYTMSTPYELTGETTTNIDAEGNQETTYVQHNYLTPSQRQSIYIDEDENAEQSVVGSHVAGHYQNLITLTNEHTETDTVVIPGNPLIDTSFPVADNDTIKTLSEAIIWLNRRTQETISLDVYDCPHLIDFNDRIIFNGNEYFLESNTAIKNNRIVNKQSLQFVRWY